MAKIAIDCDGVLADFNSGFIELVNKMFPGRLPANYVPSNWDYDGHLSPSEITAVFKRIGHHNNWWLGLGAYPGVSQLASWLISNHGHDVYIVTARYPTIGMTVAKQTEWWLKSCGIAPVNNYLGIIASKRSETKLDIYRGADFDYSLDDKAETVEQCDSLKDHKAYLLAQPWNRGAKVKRQVGSVEAFLREVK